MNDFQNGAITALARDISRIRDQILAQSQIGGCQTTHLQILFNKLESVEARLEQQAEANLAFAERLAALEQKLSYYRVSTY